MAATLESEVSRIKRLYSLIQERERIESELKKELNSGRSTPVKKNPNLPGGKRPLDVLAKELGNPTTFRIGILNELVIAGPLRAAELVERLKAAGYKSARMYATVCSTLHQMRIMGKVVSLPGNKYGVTPNSAKKATEDTSIANPEPTESATSATPSEQHAI